MKTDIAKLNISSSRIIDIYNQLDGIDEKEWDKFNGFIDLLPLYLAQKLGIKDKNEIELLMIVSEEITNKYELEPQIIWS